MKARAFACKIVMRNLRVLAAGLTGLMLLSGCYAMRKSSGSGQTEFTPPRKVEPAAIALPTGYRIDSAAAGLTFPTGVTFDDQNRPCVIESGYAYGEVWAKPRLLRVETDGR